MQMGRALVEEEVDKDIFAFTFWYVPTEQISGRLLLYVEEFSARFANAALVLPINLGMICDVRGFIQPSQEWECGKQIV